MSGYQASAALLRTRLVSRSDREQDQFFASGRGTKPATQAHLRQAAMSAVDRVVKQAARRRPTTEERLNEIGRRRRWAGGGNMPPQIRAGYSEAERAALSVIADRCRRKGFCDLCLDEIARLAGVGRTSVQNAVRKASGRNRSDEKQIPIISVRERPQERGKHLTHIIRIVSASWLGWIKRAIGFKRLNASETESRISSVEHGRPVQEKHREKVATQDLFSSSGKKAESEIWTRLGIKGAFSSRIAAGGGAEFWTQPPTNRAIGSLVTVEPACARRRS